MFVGEIYIQRSSMNGSLIQYYRESQGISALYDGRTPLARWAGEQYAVTVR